MVVEMNYFATDMSKLRTGVRDMIARVAKATAKSVVDHSPDPTHPRQINSMGSYIQSIRVSTNGVEDPTYTIIPQGHPDVSSRSKAGNRIRKIKREDITVGVDVVISNNVPHANSVEYGIGWEHQSEYAPIRSGLAEGVNIATREAAAFKVPER